MIRVSLLVSLLLLAAGCAAPGGDKFAPGGLKSVPAGRLDANGPAEPRLVDVFAAVCTTLDGEAVAAAARAQGFTVPDAATIEANGWNGESNIWARVAVGRPEFIIWRQNLGACGVSGPFVSYDAVFRAFLRFLAPQNVVLQTLNPPRPIRFAYLRLKGGVIHTLGFSVARFPYGDTIFLTRHRLTASPPA